MTTRELELCIDAYGKDIYSFCKYLTCNQTEADDLYQDTFLKAVELGEKIEYDSNPKGYLLAISLRIWKNRKRKFAWRKRIADMVSLDKTEIPADSICAANMPEQQLLEEEEVYLVRKAVKELPERLLIPVLLYYMEELSTAEIAKVMQIPKGTVLSRLHQARKILKRELEESFR